MDPLKKVERLGGNALSTIEEFGDDVIRGVQKLTRLQFPIRESHKPLKRSMSGFEAEMWVLDAKGTTTDATALIQAGKKKGIKVVEEAPTGVAEVLCLPHHHHRSTSLRMVSNLIELNELADTKGLHLFPYGTYPGKHAVQNRKKARYLALQKMFGKKASFAGYEITGYHQHYTLPRGLFDQKNKRLKYSTSSKVRRTLLDSYNLLIAADPALTTLMQSSPFVQGKYLAKDSRMLLFRDGKTFGFNGSMHQAAPLLNILPPYAHTLRDLIARIDKRTALWNSLVKKHNVRNPSLQDPKKAYSYDWGPLKINPIGTLEYRGTDMNLPSLLFGVGTMIKFALRRIQQDFMLVTPTDMKIKDAFKVEGNMLFIPPQTRVREDLQPASAYEGLANKDVRRYTQRFVKFAKDEIRRFDPEYLPLLKPVEKVLADNKTTSDRIIQYARRKGYKGTIPNDVARELSLLSAERFSVDLHKVAARLMKVYE